ncbi:MAG TPA: YfhO family protein, partial [Bryobacteraceae bacterium]|nr:YfhO family protein [Bryobacteraceae bacterium]
FDANPGAGPPYPSDVLYLYLGLPALFAIGWALGRRTWRPYAQPVAAAAVCLVMATNPGRLVYRLVMQVPLLEQSLQSYNFYEGVAAMAALVTALGVDDFLAGARTASQKARGRWLALVVTAALAGWAMRQLWIWGHGGRFRSGTGSLVETAVALVLFSAGMWVLRAAAGTGRAWLAAALLIMALADYKGFGANRRFNTVDGDVDNLQNPVGIRGINLTAYEALWTNRQFRIASDERGGPNSTDYRLWGLATPQGFDPFLPRAYHDFIEQWVPFDSNREFRMAIRNEEMLRELGVRYVITHEGAANAAWLAASPSFRLLGPDDSFYRVYEFLRAKAPYGWVDGGGAARPVGWLPERRTFQVDSERGGRFFLAEELLAGWSASVDGHAQAVERWNRVFQAVAVGPGTHTVVFEYRADGLLPGAAAGIVAAAVLAWAAARKPKGYCKPR